MLQFNLLPDVKKEYIKAKRQKRLIVTGSVIAAGTALGILLILFIVVQFVQKNNIKDLTTDIEETISSIRSIEDLDQILTIQSQLESLPELHELKPESSRIFTYLTQLTPENVKIRSVTLNLVDYTMTLEGVAPDLVSINRFADTIKFSEYRSVDKVDPNDTEAVQENIEEAERLTPFTDVTTELSRSEEQSSYKIVFVFDSELFNNTKLVELIIPEIVTTRSTQGKPDISDQTDNPLFEDNGGDQ